jgi:hypothetical protein
MSKQLLPAARSRALSTRSDIGNKRNENDIASLLTNFSSVPQLYTSSHPSTLKNNTSRLTPELIPAGESLVM